MVAPAVAVLTVAGVFWVDARKVARAWPTFSDATAESGLTATVVGEPPMSGGGVATLDWDGDGDRDVVLVEGDLGKLTLWENIGATPDSGGVPVFAPVDASSSGFQTVGGELRGLDGADFDRDGDLDLFVADWSEGGTCRVFRRDAGGFVEVAASIGVVVAGRCTTGAFGDYDGDGWPDLYVSRYFKDAPNLLFHNNGDGTFEDVTLSAGMGAFYPAHKTHAFHALWLDWDRDGDLDLYETNDRCYGGQARNHLWLNQGDGTFTEDASAVGLDLCFDAMGAGVADWNGDLRPDIFMANITWGHYLMTATCDGWFDSAAAAAVTGFQWGWGVLFEDLDLDGWPDLMVAHQTLGSGDGTDRFWRNPGGTVPFQDLSAASQPGVPQMESFMVVRDDLDGDGDRDLLITAAGVGQQPRLLLNQGTGVGGRLVVELEPTVSAPGAVGAIVDVLGPTGWQRHWQYGQRRYGALDDGAIVVGLAASAAAAQVLVYWPSGARQRFEEVPTGSTLVATEPLDGVGDAAVPAPYAERCGNAVDEDCDGLTDEGFGLGQPCVAVVGACGVSGTLACAPDGLSAECVADVAFELGAEVCGNGIDDDCDGATDEGFEGVGQPCVVGVGACQAGGVLTCDPIAGLSTVCEGATLAPETEACGNGVDDDCDGATDEGFEEVGQPCLVGVGACATIGIFGCGPEGAPPVCLGEPGAPDVERCGDGVDQDCDGLTDEGFDVGTPCTVGAGPCAGPGLRVCAPSGTATVCAGVESSGTSEACNGLDDDCDGVTDEGLGLGEPCEVGLGACTRAGVRECVGGGTVGCSAAAGAPSAVERCDGADDDCDGLTDEGFALGAACVAGVGGCARAGARVCLSTGEAGCDAVAGSPEAEEGCGDGVDDDCDGRTDEGCVGETDPDADDAAGAGDALPSTDTVTRDLGSPRPTDAGPTRPGAPAGDAGCQGGPAGGGWLLAACWVLLSRRRRRPSAPS